MPNAPRRRREGRSAAPTSASPERGADETTPPTPGVPGRGTGRVLADGRVQMLVYLPPSLVKAVKHAAVEQDVSASHVVEQAVVRWLAEAAERSR